MTKSKRKTKTKKIKLEKELETKEVVKENQLLNVFEYTMNLFNESAKFLLFLITLILLITSLLFVVNVEITKFHLPIISIIAIITYLLYKKKNLKNVNLDLPIYIHGGACDPVSNMGKGLYVLEKQYKQLGVKNRCRLNNVSDSCSIRKIERNVEGNCMFRLVQKILYHQWLFVLRFKSRYMYAFIGDAMKS